MPEADIYCRAGQIDLFALHASHSDRFPYLLESCAQGSAIGRYSLLLGDCSQRHTCHAPNELDEFFQTLPAQLSGANAEQHAPPFCAGWFVYMAYEAAAGLLPHLPKPVGGEKTAPPHLLALAVYCRSAIVVDHQRDLSWYISELEPAERLAERIKPNGVAPEPLQLSFTEQEPAHYRDAVRQAVDYIRAGDIYQANLSRRWRANSCPDKAILRAYQQLRRANAADFAACIQDETLQIASASPERLFLHTSGQLQTRPIAGTRPRGQGQDQDDLLRKELLAHPKEQAEHIMLVDLERNDLGKVCEAGSIQVDELLGLESYASVHHIVSNITGRLAPNESLRQIFSALFPGGTITGCPKIRCMQIIHELEQRPRGAYTGSLGYISNCGRADFNILIRSLVEESGQLHFDAGAGIVADSDPERELRETEAKAAGLMRALT